LTASLTSALAGKEAGEHFQLPPGKHLFFGYAFDCDSLAGFRLQAKERGAHLYHAVLRLEDKAPSKGRSSVLYTYLQLYSMDEAAESFSAVVIRQKREINGLAYDLVEVFNSEEKDTEQNLCLICMSEPPDCILLPCRHMVINIDCAKLIDEKSTHKFECPLCRSSVEELIYVNYDRKKDSQLPNPQLNPKPQTPNPNQNQGHPHLLSQSEPLQQSQPSLQPGLEDLPQIVDQNHPLQTN